MITPEVSICCITYNHAKYIRDALDGFLMQKTTFPIEIIIHDDASTDGTADIIREYEAKYPDIIKPIYQTENQYSKGVKIFLSIVPLAKGKYIAVCEGDDFWTDPKKLQIQYDFMESHPDYSLCMHGKYHLDYFKKRYYPLPFETISEDGEKYAYDLIMDKTGHHVQTLLLRTSILYSVFDDIKRDCTNAPMSDTQLMYHLALHGKVKFISRRMATYRLAAGSATFGKDGVKKLFFQKAHAAKLAMLVNSGHADWAEECEKLKNSSSQTAVLPSNISFFGFLRLWVGKCHYSLFKLKARIKFEWYMMTRQRG